MCSADVKGDAVNIIFMSYRYEDLCRTGTRMIWKNRVPSDSLSIKSKVQVMRIYSRPCCTNRRRRGISFVYRYESLSNVPHNELPNWIVGNDN